MVARLSTGFSATKKFFLTPMYQLLAHCRRKVLGATIEQPVGATVRCLHCAHNHFEQPHLLGCIFGPCAMLVDHARTSARCPTHVYGRPGLSSKSRLPPTTICSLPQHLALQLARWKELMPLKPLLFWASRIGSKSHSLLPLALLECPSGLPPVTRQTRLFSKTVSAHRLLRQKRNEFGFQSLHKNTHIKLCQMCTPKTVQESYPAL